MIKVPSGAVRQSISIKILNADGTVKEDRGIVSYWHRNPLKRLAWWALKHFACTRRHFQET